MYRDYFYTIISSWSSSPLCLALSLMNFLSPECSLLILTILSVVRFKCISKVGGLKRTGKTILVSAVGAWSIASLFGLLYIIIIYVVDLKIRNNMCILFIIFDRHHVLTIEYVFQVIYVLFMNILMHVVWLNLLMSFLLPKFLEFEESCQYWRASLMRCIVRQSIHYSNPLLQNCTLLNQPLLMKSHALSRKPQNHLAIWIQSQPIFSLICFQL